MYQKIEDILEESRKFLERENLLEEVPEEENVIEKVHIDISKDKMSAYLIVNISKDEKISYDDILKEVQSKVKYGIDEKNIKYLIKYKTYYQKYCIAKREEPIDGRYGYIKYYFDDSKEVKPKINEDGLVDYKELGLITNVEKGELIAEIVFPQIGKDGIIVTGEIIKHKKGEVPPLKVGKNIVVSKDGYKFYAGKDGLIYFKNNKLDVKNIHTVQEVDNSTGDIDFNGIVVVRKNVLTEFTVRG